MHFFVAASQGRNPGLMTSVGEGLWRGAIRRCTPCPGLTPVNQPRHGGVRLVSHRARTLRTHVKVHNTLYPLES